MVGPDNLNNLKLIEVIFLILLYPDDLFRCIHWPKRSCHYWCNNDTAMCCVFKKESLWRLSLWEPHSQIRPVKKIYTNFCVSWISRLHREENRVGYTRATNSLPPTRFRAIFRKGLSAYFAGHYINICRILLIESLARKALPKSLIRNPNIFVWAIASEIEI